MARIDYPVFLCPNAPGVASVRWRTYSVGGYTPEPAPTPPVVSNVLPAPGSIESTDAVSFDVTDTNGLRRVLITASFAGLPTEELVYDGTFRQLYAQSTTSSITDGLRFSLVRHPGWPSAPTITVYPFDTKGAEG